MKKLALPILCLFLMFSLSGCGLMEDAFKAGLFFWPYRNCDYRLAGLVAAFRRCCACPQRHNPRDGIR